jgi:hypothetical protein
MDSISNHICIETVNQRVNMIFHVIPLIIPDLFCSMMNGGLL